MKTVTQSARQTTSAPRRKVQQPLQAINHPEAHLRLDIVLSLAGVSRSQWYRLIDSGEAPKPLRFGPRCSRWVAGSVSKFLAERAAKGGA